MWWLRSLPLLSLAVAAHCAPFTIVGTVTGPDGKPVAGCAILAMGLVSEAESKTVSATTDGAGAFGISFPELFPHALCRVVARHGDLPLAWANVRPGTPVSLTLTGAAARCSGVVTRTAGVPVAGAQVGVVKLSRREELHWSEYQRTLVCGDNGPLETTTDAQGRFTLGNLPTGARVTLRASATGFAPGVRAQVPAGATEVRLYVARPASLAGQVMYQGRPVPGAVVSGAGDRPVTTGPDGSFILARLAAWCGHLTARATAQGLLGLSAAPLHVSAGEQVQGVVLELQQAATITGKCVATGTGRPFAGAYVWDRSLAPGGVYYDHAVSAADGTYRLQALPGETEIICNGEWREPPLYLVTNDRQQLRLAPGAVATARDIAIEAQPTVRGQVLLPDGTPAVGVEIGSTARIDYGVAPADFFSERTDAEGRFALQIVTMRVLGPPWGIVARDAARDLAALAFLDDTDKPLTIRLQPGAWLLSRVVTPRGEPVTGWPVELKVGEGRTCAIPGAWSDDQGALRIGPLPAGVAFHVRLAEHLEHLAVKQQLPEDMTHTLRAGEQRKTESLVIEPKGRTVRGWVGDAAQAPVAGALVVADRVPYPVATDAEGCFELSGLALHGKVRVVAMHPAEPLFAGTSLEPDGSIEPDLVPVPLSRLTIRVRKPDGTPLVTAASGESGLSTIRLVSDELERRLGAAGGGENYSFSDDQGVLRMDGLIGGLSYEIWVMDRYGKFATRNLSFWVEPGHDVDLGEVTLAAK